MVEFTDVDDEMLDGDATLSYAWLLRPALVSLAFVCMFAGVISAYDPTQQSPVQLAGNEIPLLDWVSLFALAIVVILFGPMLFRQRDQIRYAFGLFVRDRIAAVGLLALVGFVVLAVAGPWYFGRAEFQPAFDYNPPVGFSVAEWRPNTCAGEVVDGSCQGSWRYPFGTDDSGRDVFLRVLGGLRTSLQIGVSAAVIAGTIGTIVGLVAGTVGGRVDTVLMHYLDVQSALPAFFVYVLLIAIFNVPGDLILIVLVFGFLSWGSLARLVRSEVLQVKEELYVQSARAAGSGQFYRIRNHILPNVTTSVFVPLSSLVPLYILYEAALSFLGLGVSHPEIISIGDEIANGFDLVIALWRQGLVVARLPGALSHPVYRLDSRRR